ncbi:MAG: exosortase-associated EpsI family protein [Verrucomicrobia bacterium]|nr:exosortase-associated EpsI family protein [Verrucomicrobiota bacterium]
MNTKLFVRSGIFLALAVVVYFLCRQNPNATINMESGVNLTLPEHVGSFTGKPADVSESEKVILPTDTEFAKMLYTSFGGEQINCQVVLSGGEKRSIHRPETCLPAQGWTKKTSQVIPVKLDDGRTLEVMKLVISRPVEVQPGVRKELTSLFLYWFIGKDITTPHHWYRILHTDWDRVVHGISHRWAYVIVSAPVLDGFVPGGKNQEQTLESLKAFIGEVAPDIMVSKK